MAKRKQRKAKRRLKEAPWGYLAMGLVILLCVVAYLVIRRILLLH